MTFKNQSLIHLNYYKLNVKKIGHPYIIDQTNGSNTLNDPITWNVGKISPGNYKMRIRTVDAISDKPVKSNGISFSVNAISIGGGGLGGTGSASNQGNVCSIYDACFCELLLNCSDNYQDPNSPQL